MKNFLKNILFALLISISVISPYFISHTSAVAVNDIQENQLSETIIDIINEFVVFDERLPGSDDEEKAGDYIISYLNENTNCSPYSDSYITDGIQSFKFTSIFDGNYYSSRNIIYNIPATNSTDKKVILCCNYDAYAFKYASYDTTSLVSTEGVNQSAGSVATLLALAKQLSNMSFEYNIEFIFFGAGTSNNAGSKFYTDGISNEDASNILLAINLDTIAVGKNLYFYIDEFSTDLNEFSSNLFKTNKTGVSEISLTNLGKVLLSSSNELGLKYTHIAQNSNNFNLMKVGILTMNIFAGDYDSGVSIGRNEFTGQEPITFTDYDNVDYITTNIGESSIFDNLNKVYNSVISLLTSSGFVEVCENSFGQTNGYYLIFGNEDLVTLCVIITFIIFIIIALIWHYKLTIKAYNARIETEFVSTVLNITANVDKRSSDDDIPKAISEIVAEDIKKDKRIKRK